MGFRGKHTICIKNCHRRVTFIFQGDIELTLLVSCGVCVLCLVSRPEDLGEIKIFFSYLVFTYSSLKCHFLSLSKVRPFGRIVFPNSFSLFLHKQMSHFRSASSPETCRSAWVVSTGLCRCPVCVVKLTCCDFSHIFSVAQENQAL